MINSYQLMAISIARTITSYNYKNNISENGTTKCLDLQCAQIKITSIGFSKNNNNAIIHFYI